jgi:hypothetical protein
MEATTTTTNIITTRHIYVPTHQAKQVRRFVNAHRNWIKKCENLRKAEEQYGTDSPQARTALQAWQKGRMPSKASKHHAYSACEQLRRYLADAHGLEMERASTVDDMDFTWHTFRLTTGN